MHKVHRREETYLFPRKGHISVSKGISAKRGNQRGESPIGSEITDESNDANRAKKGGGSFAGRVKPFWFEAGATHPKKMFPSELPSLLCQRCSQLTGAGQKGERS